MNKNKLIFLLTLILLMTGMATDIYIPSLPEITSYFKTTPNLASFTVSAFIITAGLCGLLSSMVSDRVGRKTVLLKSNIVFTFTTLLIAFSPNIYIFIFLRLLQGAAVGFLFIIPRQIIQDIFSEKEQINKNSILLTAYVISPAIAPILGSVIAEYTNWRICFIFLAICQIVIHLKIRIFLTETARQFKKFPHPLTFIGSFGAFFMTKNFNACVLISSFAYASYFVFITISSFIYINTLGVSSINYAVIFIFLALVYLISNYIMRILNNNDMKKPTIIFLGCLFNLIGCFFLVLSILTPHKILIILMLTTGAVLIRFGLGFMLALVQIMAMNQFKKTGGQAFGTLAIIVNIVSSLAAIWASSFTNLLWGLVVVSVTTNTAAVVVHKILFNSRLRFPNLKFKVFRKMINNAKMRKYIELKPYWKHHK